MSYFGPIMVRGVSTKIEPGGDVVCRLGLTWHDDTSMN